MFLHFNSSFSGYLRPQTILLLNAAYTRDPVRLVHDYVGTVALTGVYKGPLYTAAVPTTSSDGLDFFVVLG